MSAHIKLSSASKGHLKNLVAEITRLVEHAQGVAINDSAIKCWSTNSEDLSVALTVLVAACSSIHDGVTRFNLVFKGNPSEAASDSMTKEIGGFCQQIVSSLTLLPSVGASKALLRYFRAGVRAVLNSLKDVVEALLDTSWHARVNSLTGMVWEACKELQQAPKTNKLACRRQMMQWSVAVKDTIDEFQDAAKSSSAGKSQEADSDARGESASPGVKGTTDIDEKFSELGVSDAAPDDFDDFGDMEMDYSASELQCVLRTLEVLRLFRRCLKVANDALNGLERNPAHGDVSSVESLDWARSLHTCLEEANGSVGELGVLLYPPLSRGEFIARTDHCESLLKAFCDTYAGSALGSENAGGDGEGQMPLRKAVELRFGALRNELKTL